MMKSLRHFFLLLLISALIACSEEEVTKAPKPFSKESLSGFWTYKQVLLNGTDVEVLLPGFSVSNFLHLKNDDTYGKAYIIGDWKIKGEYLKLNEHYSTSSEARYYKVIAVNENSLTLEIKLTKSEYRIGVPQFEEDEILTITEIFEK